MNIPAPIKVPSDIKDRVRVEYAYNMVEIIVDRSWTLAFTGDKASEHAQKAIYLAVKLCDEARAKEDQARACHRIAERFLAKKRKPMATRLRVVK